MNVLEKNRIICGGHNTTYRKDAEIAKNKQEFALHFSDSPDYQPETKINDVLQPLIVSKYKSVVTQKKIFAYPNQTFNMGDVVDCYGCKWLITEVDANQEIRTSGLMVQCQNQIKWQNPLTGEIHSRWATVEKPYFSNLEEDKKMSVSTREFKIQMRYDEETALLDVGKRLMLEKIGDKPKTYRITSPDSMTERYEQNGEITGFIVFNVEQDQYKPDVDNKELMICDYIDPVSINTPIQPEENSSSVTIVYKGTQTVRLGSSFKTFEAVFKNADGNVVVIENPVWEIKSDISSNNIVSESNSCFMKLRVEDNTALIGNKILILVTGDGASASLEVEVTE